MNITIEEIEKSIKEILGDSDILNSNSVYEKIPNESNKMKLVIFFNKIFGEHKAIIYSKLIFVTDIDKVKIVNSSFLYLYDINCEYNNIEIDDLDDFEQKFSSIITKQKFGNNIKILSEFIEKPTFLINDWLKENNVQYSISSIKYTPKVYTIPCKSLSFVFMIEINNTEVKMIISKDENIKYSFLINNETINVEKQNLNTLVETIGETLKNNFK